MSKARYASIGFSLADYFYPSLISGVSSNTALERLQRQLRNGQVICDPPLPTTPYRLRLLTGRFVIETDDALFDAADFRAMTLVEDLLKPYRLPEKTAAALGIWQEPEEPAPSKTAAVPEQFKAVDPEDRQALLQWVRDTLEKRRWTRDRKWLPKALLAVWAVDEKRPIPGKQATFRSKLGRCLRSPKF